MLGVLGSGSVWIVDFKLAHDRFLLDTAKVAGKRYLDGNACWN